MSGMSEIPIHEKLTGNCQTCGHDAECHGSNGYICCRCPCKRFVTLFNPKEPKASKEVKA